MQRCVHCIKTEAAYQLAITPDAEPAATPQVFVAVSPIDGGQQVPRQGRQVVVDQVKVVVEEKQRLKEMTSEAKGLYSWGGTILVAADEANRRKIMSQPERTVKREISAGTVINEWRK